MAFHEKLKTIRAREGLTQEQLAERTGLSRVSIGNYERGDREPPISVVLSLAKVLKSSPSELLEWVDVVDENAFQQFIYDLGYRIDCEIYESPELHYPDGLRLFVDWEDIRLIAGDITKYTQYLLSNLREKSVIGAEKIQYTSRAARTHLSMNYLSKHSYESPYNIDSIDTSLLKNSEAYRKSPMAKDIDIPPQNTTVSSDLKAARPSTWEDTDDDV
jgi:transcriptional regulator with XRE-family HTH domain